MLHDVNDSPEHADQLIGLLAGKPAKINLIPFNPFEGMSHQQLLKVSVVMLLFFSLWSYCKSSLGMVRY